MNSHTGGVPPSSFTPDARTESGSGDVTRPPSESTPPTTDSTPPGRVEQSPLANLLTFHRSIRASLGVFDEVADLASGGVVDVIKCSSLYDFFLGPMDWHDDDETKSLLPRLLRAAPEIEAVIEACHGEHRRMEASIRSVLLHLHEVSVGSVAPDPALLRLTATELRQTLEPHLRREETEIFPVAFRVFSSADLQALASEMRARRLLRWAQTTRNAP